MKITVSTPIERTPRVLQVEGLFDLPPTQKAMRGISLPQCPLHLSARDVDGCTRAGSVPMWVSRPAGRSRRRRPGRAGERPQSPRALVHPHSQMAAKYGSK